MKYSFSLSRAAIVTIASALFFIASCSKEKSQSATNEEELQVSQVSGEAEGEAEGTFNEFFDDVIGVTVKRDAQVEKLLIKLSKEIWPYIESKPLHGSQKIKSRNETEVLIELAVQINHELMALLCSYMDAIEIMEPESLRERLKSLSETVFKKYN